MILNCPARYFVQLPSPTAFPQIFSFFGANHTTAYCCKVVNDLQRGLSGPFWERGCVPWLGWGLCLSLAHFAQLTQGLFVHERAFFSDPKYSVHVNALFFFFFVMLSPSPLYPSNTLNRKIFHIQKHGFLGYLQPAILMIVERCGSCCSLIPALSVLPAKAKLGPWMFSMGTQIIYMWPHRPLSIFVQSRIFWAPINSTNAMDWLMSLTAQVQK